MNGKIARIQDLMARGWDVEDIRSEEGQVEVLLQKGASRATVALDLQDAYDVLYGHGLRPEPEGRRAVEAEH